MLEGGNISYWLCMENTWSPRDCWLKTISGNYYLHEIVQSGDYELRIELEDQNRVLGYAGYTSFIIGGPATFYTLEVSGFFGDASKKFGYGYM